MARTELSTVTLCAAASVNVPATLAALQVCMDKLSFADCLLFTDSPIETDRACRVIPIPRLNSSNDYSEFILRRLASHIRTSHCLVVQWDGFVLNADRWDPKFLNFDYIGAPWPQFADLHNVGNGGFSLRSRRLLDACNDPRFRMGEPEDVAICRVNRSLLEKAHGIRIADWRTAESFSFERTAPPFPTFGFHGVFNMVEAIGADRFWELYRGLDDRRTVNVDFRQIARQLGGTRQSIRRRLQFAVDYLVSLLRR
jgi:hypothetical protein